jgi:membrane fusion protein (multidrug efflux system)
MLALNNTQKFIMKYKSLLCCTLAALLYACGNGKESAMQTTQEVVTLKATAQDTTVEVQYVADIHAQTYVEIRARQGGMLEAILVDEGQTVRAGQPLFRLTSTELEAEVASAKAAVHLAQAELKKAKLELQRVKGLVDNKVVAATELDLADAEVQINKAKLEDAQAALKTAEAQLSYTTIKAPFSGKINRFALKMGAMVQAGELITTLSDASNIFAYFNISEKEYLKNRENKNSGGPVLPRKVSLVLADGSKYSQPGTVEISESEFDANTGALALRARFPNPDGLLKHRSTGQVRLQLDQKNVFLIPQTAVQELQDKYFVYVVPANQLLEMRTFKPVARLGTYYVVAEGIAPGETLVAEGLQSLREGMKVQPAQSKVTAATASKK